MYTRDKATFMAQAPVELDVLVKVPHYDTKMGRVYYIGKRVKKDLIPLIMDICENEVKQGEPEKGILGLPKKDSSKVINELKEQVRIAEKKAKESERAKNDAEIELDKIKKQLDKQKQSLSKIGS